MKVHNTKLEGVLLIDPPTNFEDYRGEYVETYNQELYRTNGIDQHFVQDDIAVSRRHVLRGIHGDPDTVKLVSCLFGSLYLVIVNNDPDSVQYQQWVSFTLSDKNRQQVLVPAMFGTSYLVMSETAVFHYKQTTYYDRPNQFTLAWNDPALGIWWPVKEPITSLRDHNG